MEQGMEKIIQRFREVAENPGEYARAWKKDKGQPVIGYFCSYAPEEIMLAAGGLPYRIFGSGKRIRLADSHLQAYSCSLVRGAMEDVLGGNLDFLDGTVFPHTCDSIQRLSDMWRMNAGLDFHLDVVLPVKLDNEISRDYMAQVLKKFRDELEQALGVKVGDDKITVHSAGVQFFAGQSKGRIRRPQGKCQPDQRQRPPCHYQGQHDDGSPRSP